MKTKMIYVLSIDIHQENGQLLRHSNFHYKTKKQACIHGNKILWLLGVYEEDFRFEGRYCFDQKIITKNGYLIVNLKGYSV